MKLKKFKKLTVIILALVFILPFCMFPSGAERETAYSYLVGGVNSHPKTNYVTIYTPDYGATCGGKDSYNALEIVVSKGKVVSTGGVDNAIPDDGFVAMVRGGTLKDEIEALSLKAGDTVIFDDYGMKILFINENYSPFYSNTINFDRYNTTRTENTIIIYDKGGQTTGTNIWGSEAVVGANGFVSSVGGNNNMIPEGGYVISAVGKERIADLTGAVSLGLAVIVDKNAKTITFSFSKESIVGGMTVAYDNFVSDIQSGQAVYANLDYDKIESLRVVMKTCHNEAKKAMDGGDIATAMVKKYEFAKYQRQSENLTVENPAVEERAMWLRPEDSGTREKVNEKVKAIYNAGYNAVCIELLYNSVTIFPIDTGEYLFSQDPALGGFDVLAAYIEECHK
jgi:co-chaperonin GroES (HSP10)